MSNEPGALFDPRARSCRYTGGAQMVIRMATLEFFCNRITVVALMELPSQMALPDPRLSPQTPPPPTSATDSKPDAAPVGAQAAGTPSGAQQQQPQQGAEGVKAAAPVPPSPAQARPGTPGQVPGSASVSSGPGTPVASGGVGAGGMPGVAEEEFKAEAVKGLLGQGKGRTMFELDMGMERARIFLNLEDGSQLALLEQERLRVDVKVGASLPSLLMQSI